MRIHRLNGRWAATRICGNERSNEHTHKTHQNESVVKHISKAIIFLIIQIIIHAPYTRGPHDQNDGSNCVRGYANHLSYFLCVFVACAFGCCLSENMPYILISEARRHLYYIIYILHLHAVCSYKSNFPRATFITISSLCPTWPTKNKN